MQGESILRENQADADLVRTSRQADDHCTLSTMLVGHSTQHCSIRDLMTPLKERHTFVCDECGLPCHLCN